MRPRILASKVAKIFTHAKIDYNADAIVSSCPLNYSKRLPYNEDVNHEPEEHVDINGAIDLDNNGQIADGGLDGGLDSNEGRDTHGSLDCSKASDLDVSI